jgi:hypothetical protein
VNQDAPLPKKEMKKKNVDGSDHEMAEEDVNDDDDEVEFESERSRKKNNKVSGSVGDSLEDQSSSNIQHRNKKVKVKEAWLELNPEPVKKKKKKQSVLEPNQLIFTVWYNDGMKEHVTLQVLIPSYLYLSKHTHIYNEHLITDHICMYIYIYILCHQLTN